MLYGVRSSIRFRDFSNVVGILNSINPGFAIELVAGYAEQISQNASFCLSVPSMQLFQTRFAGKMDAKLGFYYKDVPVF